MDALPDIAASLPTDRLASQRVDARGLIEVRRQAGRTRILRLIQEGAAKIRMPRVEEDPLQAVLINTAGGMTGGDRLAWHVVVGEGASAAVTTQACEKAYRSDGGIAAVTSRIEARRDARIAWLPQETIVYDRAAFSRSLDVDLAQGSEALLVESTVFGRQAMGETVRAGSFRDRWRVRRDGRLIHAEDFRVGPDIVGMLGARAATGGAISMATVLLVAEDCRDRLDAVRAIVGEAGGASTWEAGGTGKLLARLLAEDSYALRRRLVPLIELLNGRAGLPKVWTV